jgi:hypothetical protein
MMLLALQSEEGSSATVVGQGSARQQADAEYRAKIDAKKQCLDLKGESEVIQLQPFTSETFRPDGIRLYYVTATALFACDFSH